MDVPFLLALKHVSVHFKHVKVLRWRRGHYLVLVNLPHAVQHKLHCIRLVIIRPPKPLHDVGGLTQVINTVDVSSWIFQHPSVVCCVAAV